MNLNGETETLIEQIASMRHGGSKDSPKPHKWIMLLAVIDLIDHNYYLDNKIPFGPPLVEAFKLIFYLTCGPDDWCQPGIPFFHLRSADFWKHQPHAGAEAAYADLDRVGGGSQRIHDTIAYAYFSNEAWAVISNPESRSRVKRYLIEQLNPNARSVFAKTGKEGI